jgi:hypothetical protein
MKTVDGLDHYRKLAAEAERETRAMLACARSLRLTHQARTDSRTAGRRAANETGGPKPWEAA